MADITKTIEIIFGATDDGLSAAFSKIDNSIQGVAQPLGDFTKDLLKTEAALAAAGVAMVGFAINSAGQFKDSIGEIGALFNATSEQSAQLGDDILKFASESTQSIESINKATFIAISTGTEWTEVTKQLAEAEKLAVAGSTGLDVATAALSRTMNAYGLEVGEAERVSNALFVAAQQGDTNLTSLGSAFGKLATDAFNSSVGLEEALAAVSALTVAGISTEESMTKLKQLFIALSAPSKELATAMGETNLETATLQEVMVKLNDATGGSSVKLRELIPNQEAVTAAMVLAGDASGAFNNTLEAMAGNAGKVAAAYEQLSDSFKLVNQKIANSVNVTLIGIGDDLLNEYGDIGNAIVEIFKSIGVSLDKGTLSQLTASIESFLADVADALEGVAKALPEALDLLDFSGLLKSFSNLSDEFADIFDSLFGADLDLSKPEDLAEALQRAVNIMTSFVNITKGIVSQFSPIFAAIGEAGNRLSETGSETDEATGKLLGALTILSEFGTKFGAVILILGEAETDVTRVFDTLIGAGKIVTNALQVAFDGVVIIILDALQLISRAFEAITPDFIGDPWGDIADSLEEMSNAVGQNFQSNLEDAKNGAIQLGQGLSIIDKEAKVAADAINNTNIVTGDSTDIQHEYTAALSDSQDSLDQTAAAHKKYKESLKGAASETERLTKAEIESSYYKQELLDFNKQFPAVIDETNKALESSAEATNDLTESQKTAADQTHELELQLNDLASNEKIAAMEFTANIKVAEFEADAQKFSDIVEGMTADLVSNNELIGELFGHDAPDWDRFGFDTQKAIDAANVRADEAHDSLLSLHESQVKNLEARTQSLLQGDALITVNADGLQPELTALLKSLLGFIQIEANLEGLELFL